MQAAICGSVAARFANAAAASSNSSRGPRPSSRAETGFGSGPSASEAACASATISRSSSASTSPSPAAIAASAPRGSPLVISFSAAAAPISRGARCVPPAPGSSPSFTSGRPSFAAGSSTREVQPIATSRPPPSAAAWIAATVGFGQRSSSAITSCSVGETGGLPNSEMSAPAIKVRPSAAITRARTAWSSVARRTASARAPRKAAESALTGGLAMVAVAMPSSVTS